MCVEIKRYASPRGSSIDCEPRLMKRRSQVRILFPLPLRGHVKKKKKKKKEIKRYVNARVKKYVRHDVWNHNPKVKLLIIN
jgi:hypothetical protein